MQYEILKLNIEESIAVVTISRPQALNALNTRFFQEMDQMIEEIRGHNEVHVMVITGEGKAFVAGADIAEMVDMNSNQASEFSKVGQNTFRSLELLEIPVIAAINGFALGGGCELTQACDIRIASSKAKFGQPEVNLGLIPGYAGTQRLPRLVGLGNALRLLLTGDMISAEEALRIGLVQQVVEPDQLMNVVMELAKKIASKGPKAVRLAKRVTRRGVLIDFDEACAVEAKEFGTPFGNEGREGMRAFLEKREPKW
ncbi:MAG: enoyl-CoA hydratase-related protein [Acidobacteria bacterium]|jgi:enoyl-CoA hydratase|nr:enoyl-CoA hydratase-related protein [Acidobacteriota bacterium]